MADARMLFQLVSLRLRLSDSSLESMGSTSGVARCRRKKRMGFVYLTQAVAIFRYSDSSPVIVVAAPPFVSLSCESNHGRPVCFPKGYLQPRSFPRGCIGVFVYRSLVADVLS